MHELELPDEPQMDRWSIPLNEPDTPTLPFVPPGPIDAAAEAATPDVFPFPSENDPYPSEGHHPRLFRFGEAA